MPIPGSPPVSVLSGLLGRLVVRDPRDADFPAARRLAAAPPVPPARRSRFWVANAWWGDQSKTPASPTNDHPYCTGFASAAYLADGPVFQSPVPGKTGCGFEPLWIYGEAQKVDEWPGEDYDGTTVRAAMKVLQTAGYIADYHWAQTIDEMARCILMLGPMVLGMSWYADMFQPDRNGFVSATGPKVGGHAWVANGVDVDQRFFRCKNSWGRQWGSKGHFFVTFETMRRLLEDDGEACIASEIKKAI